MGDSTLDKIVNLVQDAQENKASGERISTWFGQRYTFFCHRGVCRFSGYPSGAWGRGSCFALCRLDSAGGAQPLRAGRFPLPPPL